MVSQLLLDRIYIKSQYRNRFSFLYRVSVLRKRKISLSVWSKNFGGGGLELVRLRRDIKARTLVFISYVKVYNFELKLELYFNCRSPFREDT